MDGLISCAALLFAFGAFCVAVLDHRHNLRCHKPHENEKEKEGATTKHD